MIDFFNKLYKVTEKEFFSEMKSNLSRNNKMFIVTANPEAFMYGGNDIEVKKLLLDEKLHVVADGIGLVKLLKCWIYRYQKEYRVLILLSNYWNMEMRWKKVFIYLALNKK